MNEIEVVRDDVRQFVGHCVQIFLLGHFEVVSEEVAGEVMNFLLFFGGVVGLGLKFSCFLRGVCFFHGNLCGRIDDVVFEFLAQSLGLFCDVHGELIFTKVLTGQCRKYRRQQMDTERAGKILERSGLTKKEFAEMMGVKPSTARLAFSLKRFSKAMVARLEDLESELDRGEEKDRGRRLSVIEGVVRQTMDIPLETVARVYGVPKNRFLRLIEFRDGTHGKIRCKPDRYLKLGEEVRVTRLKGDMWEVVRG